MTDREKLLELIAIGGFFSRSADAEKCVDYLIANGVAPVVRCRKCEHLRSGKNNFGAFFWCGNAAGLANIYDTEKDYCPRGERMDKDGEDD